MSGRIVVLVDDNADLLSAVAELMREYRLEVMPFLDFESARHYLQEHAPDALVTDVRLGAFNGLHLLVLAKQWAPKAVTSVYSGYSDPVIEQQAARWGAGYASKDDIVSVLLPALLQALDQPAQSSASDGQ